MRRCEPDRDVCNKVTITTILNDGDVEDGGGERLTLVRGGEYMRNKVTYMNSKTTPRQLTVATRMAPGLVRP